MIRVACPECSAEYSFADEQAGKGYTCKKCQLRFRLPADDKSNEKTPPPVEKRSAPPPAASPVAKATPQSAKQTVAAPTAREDGYIDINPCPKCGVKLFVDRDDLDTEIECPDCRKIFLAEEVGTSSRYQSQQKQRRRSKEPDEEGDDREIDSAERDEESRPKKRPPKKRRKLRDEDDVDEKDDREDRDELDDQDEPKRRPARKKLKRSQLQKLVVGTGIAMTCVGGLGIALVVIYAISILFALGAAASNPNASGAGALGSICGAFVAAGIMATVSVQIFRSGSNFYSQADHHNAMIGAVLCMIPCHAAFLIGLPVGIVSLILLMRKDVKKLFG